MSLLDYMPSHTNCKVCKALLDGKHERASGVCWQCEYDPNRTKYVPTCSSCKQEAIEQCDDLCRTCWERGKEK